METLSALVAYLLSACGLTVLLVWPQNGPSAWVRERLVKQILPGSAREALDCYICTGFWCGLLLSFVWWWFYRVWWYWAGCLMTPAVFWFLLYEHG
jgi:hypothetical protein